MKKLLYILGGIVILIGLVITLFVLNYSITGRIINIIDSLPVGNIEVNLGDKISKTDINGQFEFSKLPIYFKGNLSIGVLDKYETTEPIQVSFFADEKDLKIQLVPTALETQKISYSYIKHKQYGEDYDLLHPDIQVMISKENFIDNMKKSYEGLEDVSNITFGECEYGEVKLLPTWEYKEIGKTYIDVAVIQYSCLVIAQTTFGEMKRTYEGTTHLVKNEGYWRWFLAPDVINQINQEALTKCLLDANLSHINRAEEECEKRGIEKDYCFYPDLPKSVRDDLDNYLENLENECHKKYPVLE